MVILHILSILYSHYISSSNLAQVLCFLDSSHNPPPLLQEYYLSFTFYKKWLVGWNIMVIALLLQRISYLFSSCWHFRSHKILSCCLIPFCLHSVPDHIQDKVGVMHASKYAGGENPPTKEPPTGIAQEQQESPHKWKKWQL